jgi:hypothetical protein
MPMARTNFKYEKRQKELAKQQKAEEKRLRKLAKRNELAEGEAPESDGDTEIDTTDTTDA